MLFGELVGPQHVDDLDTSIEQSPDLVAVVGL
jgi:hypothetical protein